MRAERAICLCIDDVGLHPHVNEAAVSLLSQERVQAIGCMTGAPAWADAAERLRQVRSGPFDVGLHLDFTAFPLSMAALPWTELFKRGMLGRLNTADLRTEITAQLDAFESHMGRAPDFVDGHQHVHQFPQIRQVMLDLVLRRFPARKPWLRATRAAGFGLKPLLIGLLGGQSLITEADLLALRHNRALLGVYDFKGGPERYERLLQGWLLSARHGDLLMCHPSLGRVPGDGIAQARMDEFDVLDSPLFEWMVRSRHLRLLPMSRILEERAAAPEQATRP